MRTVRLPLLRGALFIIALAAIAFIMARGDNPAQATTYDPHLSISVSDPNPGAAADIMIDFSLAKPDSFPNVRTKSTIQFVPKSWGVHVPETEEEKLARVGGIAGTFNALSTLGIMGSEPCLAPIPVPFTMIEATTDTSRLASALDLTAGDRHPSGLGYSGQFADDADTLQTPADLGLTLIPFNADEKASTYPGEYPFDPLYSGAYRDVDNNNKVSPGDVRLILGVYQEEYWGYALGSVVQPGDLDIIYVTGLRGFDSYEKHAENVSANGVMDPGEWIYYDRSAPFGEVSYGDWRLFSFGANQRIRSTVEDYALPGGVSRYPDFLNQMFPPEVIGEPLARMWAGRSVIGTPVSLNILTFRPGQLPGYPAQLGYPNVVIILNPVVPVEMVFINQTSDLCTPLSLTSTNFGVSQDNPATSKDENGYVRLTNPRAEKSHDFTLVSTSQPDADDDGIENMLDTCPLTPNTENLDERSATPYGTSPGDPDADALDGACDPDPSTASPYGGVWTLDEDVDSYGNRADNCSTVANGKEFLGVGYEQVPGFTFMYAITGDLIGPSDQADTDGDDIGDACEGAESGAQCLNDIDDDADGVVNDGCSTNPYRFGETGGQCDNGLDDDGDGKVNDGCPRFPPSIREAGDQCLNATDDDADGLVNDGCPWAGSWWETTWNGQCSNALDDDGDGFVNDGCPVNTGVAESGAQCHNDLDDNGNGKVNEGCPTVTTPGVPETQCDNDLDDDADGLVNDGCPSVDPGDVAKTTITGHMHVRTLTQGVTIARHGVKLDDLDGKDKVAAGGSANYKVSLENKGGSAEDFPVALRVVEGCGVVTGPATVHVNGDASANAQFTVDFSGCADGEYTVQADACHAGDADAGLFGVGDCPDPGTADGLVDTNQMDDAPRSLTVVVGSP